MLILNEQGSRKGGNLKYRSGAPSPLPDHHKSQSACAAIREFQDIRSALAGCAAQGTDALEEQSIQA